MKFAVYAALIATTQAGELSAKLHSAEAEEGKKTVEDWVHRAGGIVEEAKPVAEERNRQWYNEWVAAEQREMAIKEKFGKNLEDDGMWLDKQLKKNDEKAKKDLMRAGVDKDLEHFMEKVETDMKEIEAMADARRKSLMAISNRPNKLATLESTTISLSEQEMPTEEELDQAEATLVDWMERAEDIKKRADPAHDERDKKIYDAYVLREHQNEKTFWEAVEQLDDAQKEFESEVMDAQRNFEMACEQDGSKADWDNLMKQVQADMAQMEKMYRNTQQLAIKVKTINMASEKFAVSLGKMSQEMKNHPVDVAAEDAKNKMLVNWVAKFEELNVKVRENEQRRNEKIMGAAEEREEEVMNVVETTMENWEANDKAFENTVMDAQNTMLEKFNEEGVTRDAEELMHEIDATLHWMATSMFKVNRNIQSLGAMSDKLNANLPTGAEKKARHEAVTGWVSDLEDIDAKVAPIMEKEDERNMKDWETFAEHTKKNMMTADEKLQASNAQFQQEFEASEYEALDKLEKQGTTAKAKKLGDDIEMQLKAWGM